MIRTIVAAMTTHPGWEQCEACSIRNAQTCPIWENRGRIQGEADSGLLQQRLTALVELSEQNGVHFPVRQLLALVANVLLGHPDAPDGIFGENLKPRRAEKSDLFRKLNAFGIGGETSNRVDNLLVYGADDPALEAPYRDLVLNDPVYGGTAAYTQAQRAYLEGSDTGAREVFLPRLRAQRQRMFCVLPEQRESEFDLWDLTVLRYGGLYLDVAERLKAGSSLPRRVMPMIMRGLIAGSGRSRDSAAQHCSSSAGNWGKPGGGSVARWSYQSR